LKEDDQAFSSLKTTVVVVAPHDAETVAEYWKREALPMIGLPDQEGRLAELYGQEWRLLKLGRMPALFLIDRKGTLAYAHYGESMADIPKNSEMLRILEGMAGL
jgi:peroxiredoxin Q/BCP